MTLVEKVRNAANDQAGINSRCTDEMARAAIAVVLEEAAKVAENYQRSGLIRSKTSAEIAAAIRALATQSPPPFLTTG